jgi:hypothetical protein
MIGCLGCLDQPQEPASDPDGSVVEGATISPEVRSKIAAARAQRDAVSAVAGADVEIPGCAHDLQFSNEPGTRNFRASASLSCPDGTEYAYVDVVAYSNDLSRGEVTVIAAAAAEVYEGVLVETLPISGTLERRRGTVLTLDSIAITITGDLVLIGQRVIEDAL